jgi:hypothetical protein
MRNCLEKFFVGSAPRAITTAVSFSPGAGKILILTFVHNLHLAQNRRKLIILRREESGREASRLSAGFFIDYP